ncbi:hypothetical protein KY285_001591 [Solanum tuberosum]|nr:hypothetical protein KY285_001591 [Solanum tuberosum]
MMWVGKGLGLRWVEMEKTLGGWGKSGENTGVGVGGVEKMIWVGFGFFMFKVFWAKIPRVIHSLVTSFLY